MFKSFFEKLLDLIYKQKCIICSCSKTDNFLCKNCAKDVEMLSFFPHRIYNNIPIYSAYIYDKNIKKLIHLLKFKHRKKASAVIADLLFQYFQKLNLNKDFIIIYPDSFYFKNLTRGYEHMQLIAENFARLAGLKYYKHVIKKTRNTIAQYQAKNRKENIKGSFEINKKYIDFLKQKTVLLIDDIITTGATIEEIINLLHLNNIDDIICLTFSKTV